LENESDPELVQRCRGGDRAAFPALVKRYYRAVYNAAYRVLGNSEDASDVTQAVFLKVGERLGDYDPRHLFFSWIYRIALNEALNVRRSNRRTTALDEDAELAAPESWNPERRASQAQACGRIQEALMAMKIDDRAVITLRHFSDCSYREMAAILGVDEKTVKSRLFEARRRIRELLKDLAPA
jgi:RNA polymerase sigma-70 factor, ECF subfamily